MIVATTPGIRGVIVATGVSVGGTEVAEGTAVGAGGIGVTVRVGVLVGVEVRVGVLVAVEVFVEVRVTVAVEVCVGVDGGGNGCRAGRSFFTAATPSCEGEFANATPAIKNINAPSP